jgi:hypothetical protein
MYVCLFLLQQKWCFNVIDLCHINANPIWIIGHNVGPCISKNVNSQK